ncbi:DUF1189 domain-containing protein [Salipaludibacillus sp. HK11]|uniref:DUF1189 domain-containing protein n=1 Tax=Salipaludibacillus sp. HK11 TaxID=3394320 RepID=UPI0039FBF0F4
MNIFQQLIKSLHSPETISKFRFQKIGKTILYVFFLMLVVSIPMAIFIGINVTNIFNDVEGDVIDSIPDFSIENGVLHSDIDEPMIIEDGDTTIIFDSTGEYRLEDAYQYDSALLLLEREAAFIAGGTPDTISYQEFGVNISKDQLNNFVNTVGDLLPLIISFIILLVYIFTTGMKFIGILVLSVITLLLKRNKAEQLSYRQGWVLSAYVVTLPTILFAIIDLIGINIPFSLAIYWIIATFMMISVLKYVPNNTKESPTEL